MGKSKITQYQQNVDIIKGFFRKPIILITGIVTIVACVFSSIANYLSGAELSSAISKYMVEYVGDFLEGENSNFIIGTASPPSNPLTFDYFSILTGLALILLFASAVRSNSLRGAVKFYKVLAHIQYIISFVFAVVCVLLIIGCFIIDIDSIVKLSFVGILILVGTVVFMLSLSKLRFATSVQKSISTIYLSKSFANLFGAFSLVYLSSGVVIFILLILYGATALTLASVSVSLVPTLLTAIMAFMYDGYITAVEKGEVKLPEPVATKEAKVQEMICKNCGTPYTDEDLFCHVCGTKLT